MSAATLRGWAEQALREVPLVAVALVLLAAGAEIMPPDTLLSAGEVKLNLERLIVLAGLLSLAAVWRPGRVAMRTGLAIPLALLLGAGLIATIKWGTEPRFRFLVESVAVFYLVVGVIRTRPEARLLLAGVAVVSLALPALSGIAQVSQAEATGFYRQGCEPVQLAPPLIPDGSLSRAIGTFANPNVLAGHLLLLLPLSIGAAFTAGRSRLAVGVVAALGVTALALTLSRAGVIALLLAGAVAVLASPLPRRRILAAGIAVLAVVAGLALGTCGGDTASGDFGRTDTWRETVRIAADEPVTGVGLGRTADRLRDRNSDSTFRHGHDLWLTWWADAGTGAFLAWLAIAAVLMWRGIAAARTGDPLSIALLGSLTAFLLFSVGDHPANVDRVALSFWVVAGLVAAGPRPGERGEARA